MWPTVCTQPSFIKRFSKCHNYFQKLPSYDMVFHTGPVYDESQDLLEGDLEIQLLSDYFDEKKYGNSTLISTFRITYNDSYNCENRLPELLAAGNNAIQELEIANEAHILKHDFGYYLAMVLGAYKRGGYQKF